MGLAPGKQGINSGGYAGGGGGGSFLWNTASTSTPLVVAGGGGGGGYKSIGIGGGDAGVNASITTNTNDNTNPPIDVGYGGQHYGTALGGGSPNNPNWAGGAGAGWLGNGAGGGNKQGFGGDDYTGNLLPGSGGGGGAGGGFGGGGGGGYNGGGGGGGYNGGGGGYGPDNNDGWGGSGGGSGYWNGLSFVNPVGAVANRTGDGSIVISYLPVPTMMLKDTNITNTSCFNGANGSATIKVISGGVSPYTYSWNPGGNTNATATGLSAGTYVVSVTDKNGCSATTNVTVSQPAAVIASVAVSANISCNGGNNGSATVTASGGTPAYTYSWAPPGQTNATATGLGAGTYTITVKDANGCTGTASIAITQPTALTVTAVANNVLCNGGVGSATATPAGGTGPYTYFWTPSSQTAATATGLRAGTYTIKITDNNGCTATTSITPTQPNLLIASIATPTYPPCNGGVGSATASGSGGTSPYTYSWNPTLQTTATATGLSARTYTVTVEDYNACTSTTSVVITQPTVVAGSISVVNPACNGNTGNATVTASGGTPGYKYLWANGETAATATGLLAGSYTVTITDAHGCTGTVSTTLTQPATLNVTATFTHASCSLPNGTATASPTGGTPGYIYAWSPGGQTNITATNLLAGTYTVKVTDSHNCTASTTVTITQPTAVTASISNIVNVTCSGKNDGSASVAGGGGTAPYGYQWSPAGGTGATGTGAYGR